MKSKFSKVPSQLSVKSIRFLANPVFPLLLRCNFFTPSGFSVMLLLSIQPIPFCWQKFFIMEFLSLQPLSKFTFSFLTMTFQKANLVFGDNSVHFFRIFLKLFKELIFVARSSVPALIITRLSFD